MNSSLTVYPDKMVPEQCIIIIILLVSVWWRVNYYHEVISIRYELITDKSIVQNFVSYILAPPQISVFWLDKCCMRATIQCLFRQSVYSQCLIKS